MALTTSLIGQEEVVQLLNEILPDPPHIFLSGGYGSGKTTLMKEFLSAYYKPHGISIHDPEWTLWLSSEQDRGIHCVRQSVAEFVRHSNARPGVYRWIVVDDADSLPIISQQALRRPMETHAHTTRFLFVSRHVSDLIQPLKSRCLHIEIDTISPMLLVSHFCEEAGFDHVEFDPSAIAIFMSLAKTPTQIRCITRLICKVYGGRTEPITARPKAEHSAPVRLAHVVTAQPLAEHSAPVRLAHVVTSKDILALFASPSFSLCLDLLRAYIRKDTEKMMNIFLEIWTTGISYEDFLHELTSSVHQMGILPPIISQDIHQLILKGWILFAQGKTHSLDLMRLFFPS